MPARHRPAPIARQIGLCLLLLAAATPSRAQVPGPDPEALKATLLEVLSLATFGTLAAPDSAMTVTPSGADFLVRLPLPSFTAPPDAALTAIARPLDKGRTQVTSVILPASGTIEAMQPLWTAGACRFQHRPAIHVGADQPGAGSGVHLHRRVWRRAHADRPGRSADRPGVRPHRDGRFAVHPSRRPPHLRRAKPGRRLSHDRVRPRWNKGRRRRANNRRPRRDGRPRPRPQRQPRRHRPQPHVRRRQTT